METIDKFRKTAAALGLGDACLYTLSRLTEAIFGGRVRLVKYYFTAQPVDAPDPGKLKRTGSFSLDWLGPSSELFAQVERPPAVLAARFAQRARCLGATAGDGRLAGFLWYVVGPYAEDEVRADFIPRPEEEVAWDFDVMVMPRYRMGRLFGYLWGRAMSEMAKVGIRQTVSRISAFNAGSIASHRRLGARVVGQATFLCVGDWQLMKSSMPPRWHVSSSARKRPVLEIHA